MFNGIVQIPGVPVFGTTLLFLYKEKVCTGGFADSAVHVKFTIFTAQTSVLDKLWLNLTFLGSTA